MLIQKKSLRFQNVESSIDEMREDAGKGLTDEAASEFEFNSAATETEACGLSSPEATFTIHFNGCLQHKGAI